MSVLRWKNLPPERRDQFGGYLCRLCKAPCADDSRHWCSVKCLEHYLLLSSGDYVRAKLFERDRGICAECGVDGERMNQALAALKDDLLHPLLMSIHPMIVATLRSEGWTNVRQRGRGSYADCVEFTSCWEADHITAVSEGGGQCALSNFRTLCFVCHKKQSAKQAGTRAAKRRQRRGQTMNFE
jgi:5-methylcytosine-specific restriction protein A